MITGNDLIQWGYTPGPWFADALRQANASNDPASVVANIFAAYQLANAKPPEIFMKDAADVSYFTNIEGETEDELTNIAMVESAMANLVRVPTVVSGAIMPDACPAGIIPVGGIVATENAIHPGFHSADVCCSVAVAVLGNVNPKDVLDRAMQVTHFGVGGRQKGYQYSPSAQVVKDMENNKILQWNLEAAHASFATQGDGNHFLFVGTIKSTGETAVVTHHGSRNVGARLYKAGNDIAERYRLKLAPSVPKGAGWIPADTDDGETYWEALQIVKDWTRESHFKIHQLLGFPIRDWFWNEHNFVFQKSDGLFYHAKGATPGWADYDTTIVPLNMAQPILLTRGSDNPNALGFLPHGAGRNLSRTTFNKRLLGMTYEDILKQDAPGIDVRFFFGKPDMSEMPSAYKSADQVKQAISKYGLAEIVDEIIPYGSIMAGEGSKPWLKQKVRRIEARKEYKDVKRRDRRKDKQELDIAINRGEFFDD